MRHMVMTACLAFRFCAGELVKLLGIDDAHWVPACGARGGTNSAAATAKLEGEVAEGLEAPACQRSSILAIVKVQLPHCRVV